MDVVDFMEACGRAAAKLATGPEPRSAPAGDAADAGGVESPAELIGRMLGW